MKITIESTDQLTDFAGVPCRAWTGTTEQGVAVLVLVHRIVARADGDCEQLGSELREMPPPRRVPLSELLPGA